jgi:DNA-binding transcriptional ArsR family regulator
VSLATADDSTTEAALRAIAHAGRRRMLRLVWDTERGASELAERCGLSRPAASQHLKVLREAALVEVRARGNQRLYRARTDQLAKLRAVLDDFWAVRLDALRSAVERRAAGSPEGDP